MSRRCIHCNSTGVCKFCKGTGKSGGGSGRLDCIHCNGTGICNFCHGASAQQGGMNRNPQMGSFNQPRSQPSGFGNMNNSGFGNMNNSGFGNMNNSGFGNMRMNNMSVPGVMDQQEDNSVTLPDGRKMEDLSPDELVDVWMQYLSGGGFNAKMMRWNIKAYKTFGTGFSDVTRPLLKRLEAGTSKELMAACDIVAILGEKSQGLVIPLAELLNNKHAPIREKAMDALKALGDNAAPAEEYIKNALNDSEKSIKKTAKKLLKTIDKIKPDKKMMIIEDEEHAHKLLNEVKVIEQQAQSIDKGNLAPSDNELSKYKNVFFMSHALDDFPWVKKAMEEISSWPNCYCWTCERDIPPGGDWLTEIYKGLDACNWYILFWSEKAKVSNWTNEEIREAKTRNVGSGSPLISTVNLGCNDWPKLLSRHQGALINSDDDLNTWLTNLKQQVQF